MCGTLHLDELLVHLVVFRKHFVPDRGHLQMHHGVRFHFTSGDTQDLTDRLDAGLFDFCVLFGDIDREKYGFIELPFVERWGVVMPADCDLAKKETVEPKELWDKPLIMSRQSESDSALFFSERNAA